MKRPDADHVRHVERGGFQQPEAPQQVRLFCVPPEILLVSFHFYDDQTVPASETKSS